MTIYGIEQHSHRFAAWAAGRAASVKGCRFGVEEGRKILEESGFVEGFSTPNSLPEPSDMDNRHREWRISMLKSASIMGLEFTHGVAAKLINCYLKARFVCAGLHADIRVASLHPPIDKLLLEELSSVNFGNQRKTWKNFSAKGWSKFSSGEYEEVIHLIRRNIGDQPLWMIEEFWVGNQ